MTKKIQLRGNCQCCGKQQAVVGSVMSKHGYTVEQGWFNGVCSGDRHAPIQVSRNHADSIISDIRSEIPVLLAQANDLDEGKTFPKFVSKTSYNAETRKRETKLIPFAEATSWDQKDAVKQASWALRSRARAGESFANDLEEIANRFHNTPLIKVEKKEVAPIQIGEKRTSAETGLTYTCLRVDGARVYWSAPRKSDGKIIQSWTGSTAWRKMETL